MNKLQQAVVVALLVPAFSYGAVMTNKDVLSLLEAGMSEDVILQAIRTSEPRFDTSANALILLKKKGASPAVLKAMMPAVSAPSPRSEPAPRGQPAPQSRASDGLNPEEVQLLADGPEVTMQYILASNRTAARALGFGGVATYAVLPGPAAARRLVNNAPEFIVSVPKNAQAPQYVTLANFAVRPNGTREVLIGGGYMSYSTGVHPDRIVKVTAERLENQSRAREGFVLYRVRPEAPMKPGEYALILYSGEVKTVGFFAHAANSYFDFGID
jgi:hypothetical protein